MVVIGAVVGVYVIGLEPGLGDFSNENCFLLSFQKVNLSKSFWCQSVIFDGTMHITFVEGLLLMLLYDFVSS